MVYKVSSVKRVIYVYKGNSSKEFLIGLKCLGAYMSIRVSAKCNN